MLTWVVGAGGLLGSNVQAVLVARTQAARFDAGEPIPWDEGAVLSERFRGAIARFLRSARDHPGWAVVWCAGKAVVASGAAEVAADGAAFARFLAALEQALLEDVRAAVVGHVVLASSAGGVWAGHEGAPITEATPVRPISDYGSGHLAREAALHAFAGRQRLVRTATVRLSNLYGPGQRLDKPQGLVSQIARSLIQRRPIHLYVPLDTVRDYLFAADAGRGMADVLDRLARTPEAGPEPLVKILASEQETSVGGLLSVFRQVSRRRVALVSGVSPIGLRQPLRLRFRSELWTSAGRDRRTPLLEGVVQVYRHLLSEHCRGTLAAPA